MNGSEQEVMPCGTFHLALGEIPTLDLMRLPCGRLVKLWGIQMLTTC